eukprot:g12393.t1
MNQAPAIKRFCWLKRLSLLFVLLLLLVVGLRLIWGHRVQSRLDEAIADIQAQGEPILFADLQSAEIPDSENAARYLMDALQNWPSVPGQPGVNIHDTTWYIEGEDYSKLPDPITDHAAYLVSCKPVLDSIRKAVALDQARWFTGPMPIDYLSFTSRTTGQLGNTRRLARLMDDASRRAFKAGDPALCFEILHLIGRHGDKVGQQTLSLIDALVMISIHAMTYDYTGEHLAKLTDEQARQPDTRQALIAMRDWLLDETDSRQAFLESLIANRWGTHQYVLGIRDGSMPVQLWMGSGYGRLISETPGLSLLLNPLLTKAHTDVIDLDTNSIETFKATDNLRDSSASPDETTLEALYEAQPWLYPMFEELFISDAAYRTYYRQLSTRRMTATAIAIRLYQADHGERPETLEKLLPEYLAQVPMDPYIGDQPIGYSPGGVIPKTEYELGREHTSPASKEVLTALPRNPLPLLYCVGHDFIDNRGALAINEYDGTLEYYNGSDEGQDHWYLLVPELEESETLIDLNASEFDWDEDFLSPLDGGEDEVEEQSDPGYQPKDEQPQAQPTER